MEGGKTPSTSLSSTCDKDENRTRPYLLRCNLLVNEQTQQDVDAREAKKGKPMNNKEFDRFMAQLEQSLTLIVTHSLAFLCGLAAGISVLSWWL